MKDDGGVTVVPGDVIIYTLSYENNGTVALDGVTLRETIPANTTFVGAPQSDIGWSCTGANCTLVVGTLNVGESGTAAFAVRVNNPLALDVKEISNTASIDDGGTASATDGDTTPVNAAAVVTAEKIALDVNGDITVPGDEIEYTITISNGGTTAATGVTFADAIPANTAYVAGSTTLNGAPVTDNAGTMPFASAVAVNSPAAPAGQLDVGVPAVVVFRVTINDPFPTGTTSVSNQGTVAGSFGSVLTDDPAVGGVADPTVTQVVNGLTIAKTFGALQLEVGTSIDLIFTLTNPSSAPLTGLTFTDPLPNGLVFDPPVSSPQCGGTLTLEDSNQTLRFAGGTLAGASSCSISVMVLADGSLAGNLTNVTSVVEGDGGVSSVEGATATIEVGSFTPGVPAENFLCENILSQSGGAMTSSGSIGNVLHNGVRGNTYCHIIAKDGDTLTSDAEIGNLFVLNLGVIQAVDMNGMLPDGTSVVPFETPVRLCLRGVGEVLFLNAATSVRTVERLFGTVEGEYTCVDVPNAGTVVLVSQPSGLPEPPQPTPAPFNMPPSQLLNGVCRVTVISAPLNLRELPTTESPAIAQLPANLTLNATERVPGWFKVIFENGQGWVNDRYVEWVGDCGQSTALGSSVEQYTLLVRPHSSSGKPFERAKNSVGAFG